MCLQALKAQEAQAAAEAAHQLQLDQLKVREGVAACCAAWVSVCIVFCLSPVLAHAPEMHASHEQMQQPVCASILSARIAVFLYAGCTCHFSCSNPHPQEQQQQLLQQRVPEQEEHYQQL